MKIYLKKNEERRLKVGHLWIFSNEIDYIDGIVTESGIASIYTNGKSFIGKGLYNAHSLIAYRHLTNSDEDIDETFFTKRIKAAEQMRKKVHPAREAFRMVYSESDFLPGLIIDKYKNSYAIQIFSNPLEKFKEMFVKILIEKFEAEYIFEKNDNELRTLEGLEKIEKTLYSKGDSYSVIAELDDIKYSINISEGQKTGFYLDQAFNRLKIRNYVSENSSVLDLFCNEGGFSLNAAFAGCKNIKAVDASDKALKQAGINAQLNGMEFIEFIKDDVFEFYNKEFQTKNKYNVIVLDPPSFTKSKKNVPSAVKGYIELNSKAMRLLHKNSFLFTYSCSHHISEKNFEDILVQSSIESRRQIQILDISTASYDHPILPQMPETRYLKGYIIFVR